MQKEYLFELGGENTKLAKCEAFEVLKGEGYKPELNFENQLFVIKIYLMRLKKSIRLI